MTRCITGVLIGILTTVSAMAAAPMKVGSGVEVAPQSPDARAQSGARVAFDGEKTYLVVWQQGRDFYETETSDIYAARISADGKALDAKPIKVCAAKESQLSPRVAFTAGFFLVVWSDLRSGKDFDVYAARIKPDGTVMDEDGFLVAGGAHNQYGPTLAPGGGKFLVAWQDFRDEMGYALRAARVSPAGKVLDARGVALGGKGKPIRGGSVSLTSAGAGWHLFWKTPESGRKGGVARVEEKSGALAVVATGGRLPTYSGCMGEPASDGKRVLYAGTGVHGRGGGFRPGTVLMFDIPKCAPMPNPNKKEGAGASGWSEDKMVCAHIPMPGLDAPVTIAHSGGVFLMAARGSSKAKLPYRKQIHAARIGSDGRMIDDPKAWQVIGNGGGPNLAGGKDGSFLLVYSAGGAKGNIAVFARVIKAK